jgi:hemerythrin
MFSAGHRDDAGVMVTINWLSRYETGIAAIDAQHLRLFEVVNDLIESFRRGEPESQVAGVVDFLLTFTLEHFGTEEALMERQGYPGLEAHRKEHQDVILRITALKRRIDEGEQPTIEVSILLAEWLEYHIHDHDQAFAEFSRGVNLP